MATQATYVGPIKGALINGSVLNWELDQFETSSAWLLAVLPAGTLATGDSLEVRAMVGVVTEEPAILEVVMRNRVQKFYFTRTGGHANMTAGIVVCSQTDGTANVYAVTMANFNKVNLSLSLGGGMPGVGGEGGGIQIIAPPLYVGASVTGTVIFTTLDETAYPPYVAVDANSVSTDTGFVSTGLANNPAGSTSLFFDPNATAGSGSADLYVTGNQGAADPGFNLIMQRFDGSNGQTFIRCQHDPVSHLPTILLPENTEITGDLTLSDNLFAANATITYDIGADSGRFNTCIVSGPLTADDAQFNTCEVANSPVRTFANTPDAPPGMDYPPAGVPQSTGTAWGASINPNQLARTNANNNFAVTQTIQGKVIATGTSPLDVSQSAATMGSGASNQHPNLTLINASAAANNKAWAMSVWPDSGQGPVITMSLEDDAGNSDYWMACWRNGITGTQVEIKPPLTLDGNLTANGTAAIAGTLTSAFYNPTGARSGTNPTVSADEGAWALSLFGFSRITMTTNAGQLINFGGSDGLTITSNQPINLPADPTQPLQAATKQYVDNSGPKVIQAADEATAISESTANPNNIYFWV